MDLKESRRFWLSTLDALPGVRLNREKVIKDPSWKESFTE
jgi:hypothetical protein